MKTKQMLTADSTNDENGGVFAFYKQVGETPLQCLERLRVELPQYKDATLSYAGRLDPLASGLLLILAGKAANQNRKEYLGLQKTYEVEVFFGVSTDSYDVLGLVEGIKSYVAGDTESLTNRVKVSISNPSNFDEMEYPQFSSKPVNGKSLFQWAREGRISEIAIPKQKGKIKQIEVLKSDLVAAADIKDKIFSMIGSVSGNFRQDEISIKWNQIFAEEKIKDFLIIKFRIECESGVYMRSFAHKLGEKVGMPALAFTIFRTKIGNFDLPDL